MVGSLRAHLNILRAIIKSGARTSLILEDDVDWDVRLKSQLVDFALGIRHLSALETPKQSSNNTLAPKSTNKKGSKDQRNENSPYREDWDLLWLGPLSASIHAKNPELFLIPNDPSVPPPEKIRAYRDFQPDPTAYPPHTRLIYHAGERMIGTTAYAVSYLGAQKLIYLLELIENNDTYDIALQQFCRDETMGLRCFGVWPNLFGQHKGKGGLDADSDIKSKDGQGYREVGYTHNVVWSMRRNMERLLMGMEEMEESLDYI